MTNINPRQTLLDIYQKSDDISDINIDKNINEQLQFILKRITKNKGVYTVLITLALYKYLYPTQDIRQYKIELPNGFFGRSFDFNYVTPTLKEIGLPAMAESGWLTRSLEQPYPYDMNYQGEIRDLKSEFLHIVAYIQQGQNQAYDVLRMLLNGGILFKQANEIAIQKIDNQEIQIFQIIELLRQHFEFNYQTHGGSKLPVLAFYAIYQILIQELSRFQNCELGKLGSHTASDITSKSGGDIEVFKNGKVFEALEIKLNKAPDSHMVRIAYDKINKFGISRYYILSGLPINPSELDEVNKLIDETRQEYGCQLIVNGLYPSLKYYLRLISDPKLFLNLYIDLVEKDSELQIIHKQKLQELIANMV
ncbi:restriction endonuclease, SacI family [Moraxella sp. Tifton1]|uniref:restriction endonuclease, SacI family n=1 Tax=Moraxella oculi TaxID=2940516 RepID=UPI0020121D4C|nr:restriction endonuclease, SacI family [Moraxella sp. Tifton1]MCL1623172.1 restriction endonuclease, SacI family [Moraxella sp. Tifton1]